MALVGIDASIVRKCLNTFDVYFHFSADGEGVFFPLQSALVFLMCAGDYIRDGDFADFFVFVDSFLAATAYAGLRMGTYQLHVMACNLDLSTVGVT